MEIVALTALLALDLVVGLSMGMWYAALKMAQTSRFHGRLCGPGCMVHVHADDRLPRYSEVHDG